MDILNDIKEIIKDDIEHHIKIEVDYMEVTVYLDYDPHMDFNEDTVIPIHYTALEEFAYIPDDKYREMYKPNDFGMDLNEITLIKNIMGYLESHKEEIGELCSGYDCTARKEGKK